MTRQMEDKTFFYVVCVCHRPLCRSKLKSTFDLMSDSSFTLHGIIIYNDVRRRKASYVVVFKWSSYPID